MKQRTTILSQSTFQQGKGQLLLTRQAKDSDNFSDFFPSPTELIKPNSSSIGNESLVTKADSNIYLGQKYTSTTVRHNRILPFNEDAATEEDCAANFQSPNNILNFGLSNSQKNGIERQFSINLQIYDEEVSFQNSSKAKLICEGADNSNGDYNQDTNCWYHYDANAPETCFNIDFNDFDDAGPCYFPRFADVNARCFPSDLKLLNVPHVNSQNSNSESTIDKTPKMNEMSSTLNMSQYSRIPRRIQQPNRFEKSLDQTLILENEFKKSTNWSKQKMQDLAQALDLTVS